MKNIFVLFAFFLSLSIGFSQDTTIVATKTSMVMQKKGSKISLTSPLDRLTKDIKFQNQSTIKQRNIFSVAALPIFCKIEHKLAKSSKVNVMMRLGSLDYVNKLEGKN